MKTVKFFDGSEPNQSRQMDGFIKDQSYSILPLLLRKRFVTKRLRIATGLGKSAFQGCSHLRTEQARLRLQKAQVLSILEPQDQALESGL